MPGIWEAEMWRDGERWETGKSDKADWEDIVVGYPRSILSHHVR